MFDAIRRPSPLSGPGGMLAATVIAGLVLALLPRRAVAPLELLYMRGIEPGRFAAAWLRDGATSAMARFQDSKATAQELAGSQTQIRRLEARNQELETALAIACAANQNPPTAADQEPPLVLTNCLRVRVLGARACSLLAGGDIVAAGRHARLTRDALVFADSATTIDSGQDAHVATGNLALAGRRVYGKVIDVGPHTAVVRRADQPGYRDVVQLARRVDGQWQFGPKGVLEGTGERQCRVRLVGISASVEAGDMVLSADHHGLAPQPLVYGTVARVDAGTGAPHWDIWVDLAAERGDATELLVLRSELNPARMARARSD